MSALIRVAESGYVPDALIRVGIRRLLRQRLRREAQRTDSQRAKSVLPDRLRPIAVATEAANEQHYELPLEFFQLMLGPRLKYSCCLWSPKRLGLEAAEEEMLRTTTDRAEVEDGMKILDLGSGWGSLGLWIAERYPRARITTVSNSSTQQEFIRAKAASSGLGNLRTLRADVNELVPEERFDRVVSIEMFEHVRDHAELLTRIDSWLAPEGKLFVHLFCHRELSYPYEIDGDNDWMARHFFTGGVMPSLDLLNRLDGDLRVARRWEISGTHYAKTLRAWLERLDAHREDALDILGRHYGADRARLWFVRWRLFLLACAELFDYGNGEEWLVGHYLLERTGVTRSRP